MNSHNSLKKLTSIIVAMLAVVATTNMYAFSPKDSLRAENEGDKVFIIHQVEQKETLYSIARRYQVKVEDITSANPETAQGLKVGQQIKIPVSKDRDNKQQSATSSKKTHIVAASQTLYSLARTYNITV